MKNFKPELELNLNTFIFFLLTVEPRYNEVQRDWQNFFTIMRFRYIEVLFHIFYYNAGGKENRLLYGGLHYIKVPL